MSEQRATYAGPGLATLLTVLFVGLKLTGHIDWSWAWVLSPLWIALGIGLLMIIAVGVVFSRVR